MAKPTAQNEKPFQAKPVWVKVSDAKGSVPLEPLKKWWKCYHAEDVERERTERELEGRVIGKMDARHWKARAEAAEAKVTKLERSWKEDFNRAIKSEARVWELEDQLKCCETCHQYLKDGKKAECTDLKELREKIKAWADDIKCWNLSDKPEVTLIGIYNEMREAVK